MATDLLSKKNPGFVYHRLYLSYPDILHSGFLKFTQYINIRKQYCFKMVTLIKINYVRNLHAVY